MNLKALPRTPKLVAIGISLVLCGILLASLILKLTTNTSPVPVKFSKGLAFPIYYPKPLPENFSVDQTSFTQRDNTLIFSIKGSSGRNIAVSEAARPSNLDLSGSNNPMGIKIPNNQTFSTPLGDAKLEVWGDKTVVSLPTPSTWIILNVTGISSQDAISVARSFQNFKP